MPTLIIVNIITQIWTLTFSSPNSKLLFRWISYKMKIPKYCLKYKTYINYMSRINIILYQYPAMSWNLDYVLNDNIAFDFSMFTNFKQGLLTQACSSIGLAASLRLPSTIFLYMNPTWTHTRTYLDISRCVELSHGFLAF